MRLSSRTSLIVAVVFGLAATFLVRAVVQNVAALSDSGASGGTIVVTRAAIPSGTLLTAENLREVPWRSTDPLEGSFATVKDLLKDGRRLALIALQRNEPILRNRVTAANGRGTLSTQLDDGMRAVTVRVDEVRGVAGFVLPGDRVDVVLTRGEGGGDGAAAYADVLLQGAKVLAVDQLADERQDKPAIARAVTLELTVQQAQKVILAQGIGHLSLALRQANSSVEGETARVSAGDLGLASSDAKDRLGEIEARLSALASASDAARAQADKAAVQRASDLEARLRNEFRQVTPPPPAGIAAQPRSNTGSVITVTRNGSKTESYTVAAER